MTVPTHPTSPATPGARPGHPFRLGVCVFVSLVLGQTVLRAVLLAAFGPSGATWDAVARVFGIGLLLDGLGAAVLTLPLLAGLALARERWLRRAGFRSAIAVGLGVAAGIQVFLFSAEFFFFEEFRSRFNTVAVDYVLYPHEVFVNVWESYPVVPVVGACAAVAAIWTLLVARRWGRTWIGPLSGRQRLAWLAGCAGLILALWPVATLHRARFGADRVLNELAANGWFTLMNAALTRELEYPAFYRTLPLAEAYAETRRVLASPAATFTGGPDSIQRHIEGDPARPRLNVVLLLEESLGSEFFGCLGRPGESLTPHLDRVADQEGWLFTQLYASGNRTVRGFEGVLCSFPPLPGDSIVVRPHSQHVETLARVLGRDGYTSTFVYAGHGVFDHMRPFFTANGYDRFLERKDFPPPAFATIWGVSNEDLYGKVIEEARRLHAAGQPFLVTSMSVSNHKPYTYPAGRIAEDPRPRQRAHAVKYTDWALGGFFEAIKREPFYTNTLFVMVADHGARVYGSETIPMKSYEIPLLLVGPAVVTSPRRIDALGGSLDIAPTLLGLIGRPYDTVFFGRDLLHRGPEHARVWLHHNRDIGLYTPGALAILGLQQATEFFRGDPRAAPPVEIADPTPAELQLQHTAMAVFQVADDLYHRGAYRVADPTGTLPLSALTAGPLRTPDAAAHPARSGSP